MVVGVQLLSPAVNLKKQDEAGFTGLPALFSTKVAMVFAGLPFATKLDNSF